MAEQDITLTFDPNLFTKAVDKMTEKLGDLEKHLGKTADATTKMEKSGARSIGIWTAVATKGMAMLSSAFNKIMGFIPEIGQSFQIAGDIIGRNLLWPLRQQLIPLLQGLLNWVRDNRAMFVRWGMVIANVFRVVVRIVKNAFEFWSKMFDRLFSGMKKIFGGTVKSVTDLLNLLLFKAAVVIVGIQVLLEPLMNALIDGFMTLVKYGKAFFEGFQRGFGSFGGSISKIINELQDLFSIFAGAEKEIKPVTEAFKILGTALGGMLRLVFDPLLVMFQGMVGGLKMMVRLIKFIKDLLTPGKEVSWTDLARGLKEDLEKTGLKMKATIVEGAEKQSEVTEEIGRRVVGGDEGEKVKVEKTGTGRGSKTIINKKEVHQDNKIYVKNGTEAGKAVKELESGRNKSGIQSNKGQTGP